MKSWIGLGLTLCLFGMPGQAQTHHPITQTPAQQSYTVANGAELLQAIGSNRVLYLQPGTYHLSGLPRVDTDYIKWNQDPKLAFTIQGVENLSLIGLGDVTILIEEELAHVLTFDQSRQILIQNLTLGHQPQSQTICLGAVVGAYRSQDIRLDNLIMFGSGSFGVWLESVQGFHLTRSEIKECSQGMVWITDSQNLNFAYTSFHHNTGGMTFLNSQNIRMDHCQLTHNQAHLSESYTPSLFRFKNVLNFQGFQLKITNNQAQRLVDGQTSALNLHNSKLEANQFISINPICNQEIA